MSSRIRRVILRSRFTRFVLPFIAVILFAATLCAQQPKTTPPKPSTQKAMPRSAEPTFDTLLAADSYKLYGEVRNVGQLISGGGAGEIIDPITKLADPPKEFKSIIKFLKTNSEALITSRLLFATWPARSDVPNTFVAIEFPTAEEAAKFAPKLEGFLPTILPPVPVAPEEKPSGPAKPTEPAQQPPVTQTKKDTVVEPGSKPQPPEERLPFVLSHTGNLVFISDKPFKFEKLRPVSSKALAEDQNFRIARDRFSTESVFLYFNVALEEKGKPQTSSVSVTAVAEAERIRKEDEATAEAEAEAEAARAAIATPEAQPNSDPTKPNEQGTATLSAVQSPTPTPTKEQQAQMLASSQLEHMLDSLGLGEPQWPEAVGVALALDNNEYIIRAILVEPPDAKKLPLPFVPQLISGPAYVADAPSVLPDDTEIFVSASIDLAQTYEGMRKQAEIKAKATPKQVPAGGKEPPLDAFAEFEKKAGFKIKEDLLPAFGNEIAIAGSLNSLQGAGVFGIQTPPSAKPSPETGDAKQDQNKKATDVIPILLIAVRDREAARRLMPRVLNGLGMGEANVIAQVEKREDTELVSYAGAFAYAFVGNFVIISEAASVRRVIDANVNHQTLSSNSVFRNSRRWQSNRTLGQIYVSPALMEGYQDEVRKQAATMDPAMRDFLLGLNPTSEAITYALSNEGLGNQHEIHLPKNLILMTVAGISSATKNPPPEATEMMAMSDLRTIATAEEAYKATAGDGAYGTLDELVKQNLLAKEMFEKDGYKIDLTASRDQFEAVATPVEYGKAGRKSFFIDKSGVLRGDDHGGGRATIADKPIQ